MSEEEAKRRATEIAVEETGTMFTSLPLIDAVKAALLRADHEATERACSIVHGYCNDEVLKPVGHEIVVEIRRAAGGGRE